jgi:hypothetical protein
MNTSIKVVPFFDRANLIINIQNILSIILASATLYNLYNYVSTNNTYFLSNASYIVGFHATIDLFLCKNEVILHHIFILCIIGFKHFCQVDNYHDETIMYTLLSTELSTFFLVAKVWMDQYKKSISIVPSYMFNVVYGINDLVFCTLFFKLRVYDYYYNILLNNGFHLDMWEHYIGSNYLLGLQLYTGICGLYALNLYWAAIIFKKLFKLFILPFAKFTQNTLFTASILKYTFFMNIPIAAYLYVNSQKYTIIDMAGIVILSCCSYNCHNAKILYVKKNKRDEIELTDRSVVPYYFTDVCAIQMRSFGLILSLFMNTIETNYPIVLMSFICHTTSIYNVAKYLLETKHKIYLTKPSDMFLLEMIVSFPSIVNTIILMFFVDSVKLRWELLMVTAWLAMNLRIEPFYKFSYVMFHVGLMMQTYVLCKMNTYVNYY